MDIDFSSLDYRLAWPPEILRSELLDHNVDIEVLLKAAFADDTPLRDHKQRMEQPHVVNKFRVELIKAIDNGTIRSPSNNPPLWSKRTGATSEPSEPDPWQRLQSDYFSDYDSMQASGLFEKSVTDGCSDLDMQRKTLASFQRETIGRQLGPQPFIARDDFFDFVEAMYLAAAWPSKGGDYHPHFNHRHFSGFKGATGRALYRWKVNQLFDRSETGLRLSTGGQLERVLPEREEKLVQSTIEAAAEHLNAIGNAVDLFRHRDGSREKKVSAIVELAGVLEERRGLLKENLTSGDENDLFMVANRFQLRHRNASQQGDYDDAFLDWIFDWYLSTVRLVEAILDKQGEATQKASSSNG